MIARAMARKGNALVKLGDLDGAIVAYNASLMEHRTADTLTKLNETQRQLKARAPGQSLLRTTRCCALPALPALTRLLPTAALRLALHTMSTRRALPRNGAGDLASARAKASADGAPASACFLLAGAQELRQKEYEDPVKAEEARELGNAAFRDQKAKKLPHRPPSSPPSDSLSCMRARSRTTSRTPSETRAGFGARQPVVEL